jgi:methyl-accepting chemotaxis protein
MTYVEGLGISTNDVKIVGSDDSTIGSVSSTSKFPQTEFGFGNIISVGFPDNSKNNSFALGVAPLEPRTMILLNNAIMKTPSDSSIKETILKNSEGNLSQNCNEITPPQTKSVSANLGNNESEKNSRSDKILRKSNENRSNNPMFDSFITGDGKYLYDELTSNKESIKILKANMDETRIRANQSKKSIDELTLKIQNINNLETSQGETIHESTQNTIDNEKNEVVLGNLDSIREDYEVNILESLSGELKDLKQSYKESYLLYQNLKKSVQDKKQNILDLKSQLVESFCEWSGQPENTRSFSIHTTSDIEDEIDPVQSSSIEESDKQHVSKLRMKLLSEELEQERTIAKHPESIPFFEARRTSNALLSQNNHSIKLLKKYKRMR